MEAKVTHLRSSITPPEEQNYSLGVTRMRIASSACPCFVLAEAPENSEVDVKTKKERSKSGAFRATLGLTPSVQIEGALGRTSGEESIEEKWNITARSLPFDNKNGKRQTTMLWDYMPNNKVTPKPSYFIKPTPSAVFGLTGGQSHALPVLEVNCMMHYRLRSSPQTFHTWFTSQSTTNIPIYTNLLHQLSVTLDLGQVESGLDQYPENLESHDRQDYQSLGVRPSPVVVKLKNCFSVSESACEVQLNRIFIGCITPTRKSKFYLLPSNSPN